MKKVEISHKTIIFTVFFLLGLYFIYIIRDIVFGLFIAVMLMTALNPLVRLLQRGRIPRLAAIWIVYLLVLTLLVVAIALLVPRLIAQTTSLIANLPIPDLAQFLKDYQINTEILSTATNSLNSIPKVIGIVTSTFSFILTVITLMVMTFYLLIERDNLHKHLKWFFDDKEAEKKADHFVNKVEYQIGQWVRGEFTLMVIIGLLTFIGLTLLGIPYALPLAILAGFLEILPNIGPTLAAVPAIAVAWVTISPTMALGVTALAILIQQIENSLIVPQIMKSAVGVNPIITIILLLVGYRLGGVGGAALAIPIFLVIKVVVIEFYKAKSPGQEISEVLE